MRTRISPALLAVFLPAIGALYPSAAQAQEPACPYYENRSGLCGYYHSEISPARAFVETIATRGQWTDPSQRPVIIDVRSTSEYKAGHPQGALNVPYPYIFQYCDVSGRSADGACVKAAGQLNQDPEAFAAYVEAMVPDKSTPIYTLCRTGVRSVGAANVLTDHGYTNVRNIWEGFVGIHLTAPKKQADGTTKVLPVDLNHDGVLDDQDKNGWRYHQGLPFETRLLPELMYQPYAYLYFLED